MKIFPHFNTSSTCLVCGTNKDKPCVLIPIDGTRKGNIEEADQVHIECLDLRCVKKEGEGIILYQLVDEDFLP